MNLIFKALAPIVSALTLFGAAPGTPYTGPKTVYILPMAGGLDQYVAQWLTRDHVLQVVADPKAAEVVMTDRLGEGFEQKMNQIRPDDVRSDDATKSDAKKDDSKKDNGKAAVPPAFRSSRAQGTIFLVDAKSRQVLWSEYQKPPRSKTDHDLNRTAEEIVRKLSGR